MGRFVTELIRIKCAKNMNEIVQIQGYYISYYERSVMLSKFSSPTLLGRGEYLR